MPEDAWIGNPIAAKNSFYIMKNGAVTTQRRSKWQPGSFQEAHTTLHFHSSLTPSSSCCSSSTSHQPKSQSKSKSKSPNLCHRRSEIEMRLPFFSSSSSNSNSKAENKNGKKQQRSLSGSDGPSFGSTSSSEPEAPTSPTTVLRPFLGRHASCLDPEYCPHPTAPLSLAPDGTISTCDLEAALARLGSHHGGVADILAEADPGGCGRIALQDLVQEEEEELRVAFSVYDTNGDGKISPEELFEVFRTLGDASCSLADCRRMIGGVDSDGDGFVCFRDFARMMAVRIR